MKRIIFVSITLLAMSLTQAQTYSLTGSDYTGQNLPYGYTNNGNDRVENTINTVKSTVITACAIQQVVSGGIDFLGNIFIPKNSNLRVYVKVPFTNKRVRLSKEHLLKASTFACPVALGIINRLP